MQVRIGVTNAKEIELNVEDAEEMLASYDKALADGDRLLWITEKDGMRHGVVVTQIAYFEIEPDKKNRVGFAVG